MTSSWWDRLLWGLVGAILARLLEIAAPVRRFLRLRGTMPRPLLGEPYDGGSDVVRWWHVPVEVRTLRWITGDVYDACCVEAAFAWEDAPGAPLHWIPMAFSGSPAPEPTARLAPGTRRDIPVAARALRSTDVGVSSLDHWPSVSLVAGRSRLTAWPTLLGLNEKRPYLERKVHILVLRIRCGERELHRRTFRLSVPAEDEPSNEGLTLAC